VKPKRQEIDKFFSNDRAMAQFEPKMAEKRHVPAQKIAKTAE
jgi:hypothetical protein